MFVLKNAFENLLSQYTQKGKIVIRLWDEIQEQYSQPERFYHTLTHLQNMFFNLSLVQTQLKDWNAILFALFYHDFIYTVTKSDNETQSADLASSRLSEIGVSEQEIEKCTKTILATKSHQKSDDTDINYFVDADLSILSQDPATYLIFTINVRKEYSVYPDFVYKTGRKNVLNHFLRMNQIYKTDFFFHRFEKKTRENLKRELEILE